jgi:multiple sugar transport system permease protein
MVLPYLFFMFFCAIMPLISAFQEVRRPAAINPAGGFYTLIKVLKDFRLEPALINTFFLLAICVPVILISVLLLALLLDSVEMKGNGVILLLIPALIPTAAMVAFWLERVGTNVLWTQTNIRWLIGAVFLSTIIGTWIVIQYGALTAIPPELLEAAVIDGCNRFQLAIRLKLPYIARYIGYMVIVVIVNAIQIFTEPEYLKSTKVTTDWSINQVAYSYAFNFGDFAGGTAVSFYILIPNILLAFLFVYFSGFHERKKSK